MRVARTREAWLCLVIIVLDLGNSVQMDTLKTEYGNIYVLGRRGLGAVNSGLKGRSAEAAVGDKGHTTACGIASMQKCRG